jgi:hypothetical protein
MLSVVHAAVRVEPVRSVFSQLLTNSGCQFETHWLPTMLTLKSMDRK